MKRWKIWSLAIAITAVTVGLAPGLAHASGPLEKGCAAPLGLAAGISWGNPDPQYMQQTTTVIVQNCNGRIDRVRAETRMINRDGGMVQNWWWTFKTGASKRPDARVEQSRSVYVADFLIGEGFRKDPAPDVLRNCQFTADGTDAYDLKGFTYYSFIQAFNSDGKKILQLATKPVLCGQNG